MSALVDMNGVSLRYGDEPVLEDVSFSLNPMDHLALLGPSGCGKSTLLSLLAGLTRPASGKITLDGELVSESGRIVVAPHARRIGMVFQDLALWPNLNAVENVRLGIPRSLEPSRKRQADRARKALDACGIGDLSLRKPAQMSAGQQQRVAIARALAIRPRLLLLDEPFTGLDLAVKSRILDEIQSFASGQQITLILVSHDPLEVRHLSRQVMVIEHHGIAEQGPFDLLTRSPKSATMRAMALHLAAP